MPPLLSLLGAEALALYAQLLQSNSKYKYSILAYDSAQTIFQFRYFTFLLISPAKGEYWAL